MTIYRFNKEQRSARFGSILALLIALSLLAAATTASPASAQSTTSSACPEMTDSIRRLYLAFFNREPNSYEAYSWTNKYMGGDVNLPMIANSLIRSHEFESAWGSRKSSEFVELLHLQTKQDLPSNEHLRHWTRALNTGYTRGEMAVALTETEYFVATTGTEKPLSGYLRWYPPGTHWYCGSGSRSGMSVQPLTGQVVFVDRLVRNDGPSAATIEIVTVENSMRNAVLASSTIPSKATDYLWFGALTGDGYYGSALQILAPESTRWAVVFYPRSIGATRLGWQISP